ncbi:unnamed protein product, partial [Porites lobata]
SHELLPSKRGFKLASLNINSLSAHIDELRILLSGRPIDILAINETKLDDTISDNEIHISGYESIRSDRSTNGRSGGGVCFFIRSEINYSVRSDLMCEHLERDWSNIENYSDPNLMWAAWKQLFLECVNKHAPLHVKRARASKSPWITPYLKKPMHDRDILKLKASRSKDANDWLQFKKCRNLVNNEIKKAKELYYKRVLDENEGNSRQTWKIVNELTSRKTNNCCIKEIKSNGNSIYGPPELADAFNDHFSSIGPKLASQIYSNKGPSHLHYLEGTDKRLELKYENLSWNMHIEKIANKIASGIGAIKRCRPFRQIQVATMVYKSIHGLAPDYLGSLFTKYNPPYNFRNSENKLAVPLPRTNFLKNSFSYNGAVIWNSLSPELRQAKSLKSFRNGCRDFFD